MNGVVEVPVADKEKSWNMNSQTSDRRVLATRGRCRWVRGSDFEHKEGIGYLTEGLGAYFFKTCRSLGLVFELWSSIHLRPEFR